MPIGPLLSPECSYRGGSQIGVPDVIIMLVLGGVVGALIGVEAPAAHGNCNNDEVKKIRGEDR